MAALSEYPTSSAALVRGDPVEILVDIRQDGTPIDVSGSDWRAMIRTQMDGPLVVSFTTAVITPSGGAVPSTVRLTLTDDQSRDLNTGMVFDLEELDATTGDTIRTWWICTRLNIQKDVSYDDPPVVPLSDAERVALSKVR
jgi:hypothetical protein